MISPESSVPKIPPSETFQERCKVEKNNALLSADKSILSKFPNYHDYNLQNQNKKTEKPKIIIIIIKNKTEL